MLEVGALYGRPAGEGERRRGLALTVTSHYVRTVLTPTRTTDYEHALPTTHDSPRPATNIPTRAPGQHALPTARQVVNASSEAKTLKAGTYTGTVEL